MKIHNKLFSTLFIFSSFLVISFVGLMQWSIDRGMVEYVNKREVSALAPLISQLKSRFQQIDSWQELKNNHSEFKQMLESSLAGSEFALPKGLGESNRRPNFDSRNRRPPPRRNDSFTSSPQHSFRQSPNQPPPYNGENRIVNDDSNPPRNFGPN